jgi:uncharacterized membrane protein
MLQLISLILVVYSYFLIQTNFPTLPRLIPTHFNAAGMTNAWGSPDVLWMVLGAQALTCAVFLLVPFVSQRNPDSVHFGSTRLNDIPPDQRARAVLVLSDMAGYLNAVMNLFFVFILHETIQAARQPVPHIQVIWPLGILIGSTAGIMQYYAGKFRRLAKGDNGGNPSNKITP